MDDELDIKAYYAGHVLGAAMVLIKVGSESVVYTVSVNMPGFRVGGFYHQFLQIMSNLGLFLGRLQHDTRQAFRVSSIYLMIHCQSLSLYSVWPRKLYSFFNLVLHGLYSISIVLHGLINAVQTSSSRSPHTPPPSVTQRDAERETS